VQTPGKSRGGNDPVTEVGGCEPGPRPNRSRNKPDLGETPRSGVGAHRRRSGILSWSGRTGVHWPAAGEPAPAQTMRCQWC